MTIDTGYSVVPQPGNGLTVNFPFTWNAISENYIEVLLEDATTGVQVVQTLGVDYTAALDAQSGTITFITAPATGKSVLIARKIPIRQEVPYRSSDQYQGATIENTEDKDAAISQTLDETLSRAILLPLGSSITNLVIPAYDAGKGWMWSATENKVVNSNDNFNDIVTDATAQAVIATTQAGISTTNAGLTAADVVTTNNDAAATAADRVQTGLDATATGADATATAVDRVQTGLDKTATNADVVTTNADVVLADQAVVDATAQAVIAREGWEGLWLVGTTYAENEKVEYLGSSYISLQDSNTGQTPVVGGSAWWGLMALKGEGIATTTKGDLATFSTVSTRLPVGTNGQTLLADSTATTGLKWVSVTDNLGGILSNNSVTPLTIMDVSAAAGFSSDKTEWLSAGATNLDITDSGDWAGTPPSLVSVSAYVWLEYNGGTNRIILDDISGTNLDNVSKSRFLGSFFTTSASQIRPMYLREDGGKIVNYTYETYYFDYNNSFINSEQSVGMSVPAGSIVNVSATGQAFSTTGAVTVKIDSSLGDYTTITNNFDMSIYGASGIFKDGNMNKDILTDSSGDIIVKSSATATGEIFILSTGYANER